VAAKREPPRFRGGYFVKGSRYRGRRGERMERKMSGSIVSLVMVFALIGCASAVKGEAEKSAGGEDLDIIVYDYSGLEYDRDYYAQRGYSAPDKMIAISFDDGPSGVTEELLEALEREKVTATFFLIGQNIRNNPAKARAIFEAGHELGNHSDGYGSLGGGTIEERIEASLEKASKALREVMGHNPAYFRAPNVNYGRNLTVVCERRGMAVIGVDCWSNDWQGIETEQIIENVLKDAKDGSIINCHELQKTVDAIPEMIDGLRKRGFWVMTVGQLAAKKGVTLEAGVQYDSIK
jgi:peptidoglycan/xylan/chitin deacetylase (PgdA/CDA1 family)